MFIDTFGLDGFEELSHRPINLLNPIPVGPSLAATLEFLPGHEREVHRSMRKVEEEWFTAVGLNEFYGF